MPKHVNVLSRLRRETLEAFAAAGIHTVDQLAALQPDDLRQFRGIKTTAHAVHAHACAWAEDRAVWYGEVDSCCRENAAYFDIETLKNATFEDEVWSIGWCEGDAPVQNVIVAAVPRVTPLRLSNNQTVLLAPDADTAWRVFAQALSGSASPIFHWTGFDAGVMRKSAPDDVTDALLPRLRDLCRIFDTAVKLPVRGISLKPVARHLGFAWHGYEDWFAAYMDYLRWRRTSDLNALRSASAYQRDDVEAMVVVHRWLRENAP